jgi:2'-5' RNA ligase
MSGASKRIDAVFVIVPTGGAAAEFANLSTIWRSRWPYVRWVPTAALHITMRFIGDTEQSKVRRLARMAETLEPSASFDVQFGRVKWLGRAPKLYLTLEPESGSQELRQLRRILDRMCRDVGLLRDRFPLRPHLTVGVSSQRIFDGLTNGAQLADIRWRVEVCHLVSRPKAGRGAYRGRAKVRLGVAG